MNLDITSTPFSRFGSRLSLGIVDGDLIVRHIRQYSGRERLLRLKFLCAVPAVITAEPHVVHVRAAEGTAQLYLRGDDSLVIASAGLDVVILLDGGKFGGAGYGFQEADQRFKFHFPNGQSFTSIELHRGRGELHFDRYMHADGIQRVTKVELLARCAGGQLLTSLLVLPVERAMPCESPDVESDLRAGRQEWKTFRAKMPPARGAMAELAWYNLWACGVRAEGRLKRDAIYMSKAHMAAIWSWDHCFNALALAPANLKLALDQFLLPFDFQLPTGQLPDRMTMSEATWLVTKPPIHGWCLQKILAAHELDRATLADLYNRLELFTNWWFEYRDTDQDGVPNYIQGCDSGWDNSTVFDPAICPESPDLPAFLVLQMETLAGIATKLGKTALAKKWIARAGKLLEQLLEHCWRDGQFVAPVSRTHQYDPAPTSLLLLMPLVLGNRLGPARCRQLVDRLEKNFLTAHGPATEMPASPKYLSDGYWRGPIWAPSTYLVVDGLRAAGNPALAGRIAGAFCQMVDSAGGHYENYDARTGQGLRDQGYTWTASVNLLLRHEFASA